MPKSKPRKSAGKREVRKPAPRVKTDRLNKKMHSSHLAQLKNDPHFLNLVKMGRVMNVVLFALTCTETYKQQRTSEEMRQYRRAGLTLGGYLHEAITLVDRIKGSYLGEPDFEPLRIIVVEPEYRSMRRFIMHLRNYSGFHLDQLDEVTRRTINGLKPSSYQILRRDDLSNSAYYFEFADYIDFAYLMQQNPLEKPLRDTADDLINALGIYASDFLTACATFNGYLWKKSAAEHVY